MKRFACRAYLQTSYFMQPIDATDYDTALERAQRRFDSEFGGEGAADELVLYFHLTEEEDTDNDEH